MRRASWRWGAGVDLFFAGGSFFIEFCPRDRQEIFWPRTLGGDGGNDGAGVAGNNKRPYWEKGGYSLIFSSELHRMARGKKTIGPN